MKTGRIISTLPVTTIDNVLNETNCALPKPAVTRIFETTPNVPKKLGKETNKWFKAFALWKDNHRL